MGGGHGVRLLKSQCEGWEMGAQAIAGVLDKG